MRIVNLVEDTAGDDNCQFEHGLSFYVETKNHKLLVDSGATDMFIRNAALRQIDLQQIDTMILSHGHYDHAGGILSFTKLNSAAKIYMQAAAGEDYYSLKDSGARYIGIDKAIMALPQCVCVDGNVKIDEELFLFSGITGTKCNAKSNLLLKRKINDAFVQDTFEHEQCLVIAQENQHILLSGCAHTGILNILDRYTEIFHSTPDIVISGFHMVQKTGYSAADITNIRSTATALKDMNAVFYTGHCTGQEAYSIMKEIMGEQLQLIHSGSILF